MLVTTVTLSFCHESLHVLDDHDLISHQSTMEDKLPPVTPYESNFSKVVNRLIDENERK